MDNKLENRTDYIKAEGYEVELRVTYTRKRRVRALNPDQAKQFAESRELEHVPNYFSPKKKNGFNIESVTAISAYVREPSDDE